MSYNRMVPVLLLFLVTTAATAQNMNSPYSIYGIGDIDFRAYNRSSGMASTGLATRSTYSLVDNNPAAVSALNRSFYIIDGAAMGRSVSYKGTPIDANNATAKDFWIKRLSIAVKLNDFWASGVGFRQFSNMNYNFYGTTTAEGTTTHYFTNFEGTGGLNEYFWTNAVSVGRHLSVGLKASVIAGSLNQTETIADASLPQTISTRVQDYVGKGRLQTGAQYYTALGKKWDISIGGTYQPKTNMVSQRNISVTEGSTILLENEFVKNDRFSLPATYAAGISLRKNKKTSFAADYTYEDWSSLKIRNNGWQLVSSNRLSAGVEFSKQGVAWNQLIEKRYFQLGAFYTNSYLQIRNEPIKEYGLTAGMGGFLGPILAYRLSIEAGSRGTTQQKLIRENYLQLTIGFSYRDLLLSKGRQYD